LRRRYTNLRNLLQPDTFDFFALEPHGTRIATADVEVVTDYQPTGRRLSVGVSQESSP
jgi:hypothetical protein